MKTKLFLLPFAILTATALFLFIDMIFNDGRILAHRAQKWSPECMTSCHGQKPDR